MPQPADVLKHYKYTYSALWRFKEGFFFKITINCLCLLPMCLLGNLGEFPEHTHILRGCYLVHLIKSVAEQILIKATSSLMKCSVVISVFIAPRFKSHF